jgi:hypothetical protein
MESTRVSNPLEDRVANLNAEQLRRLARLGAMARLTQIREEEAAIRGEFPELFGRGMPGETRGRGGRRGATRTSEAAEPPRNGAARRGRRKMSAAARRAVSVRMRKYWAERRKAKGNK